MSNRSSARLCVMYQDIGDSSVSGHRTWMIVSLMTEQAPGTVAGVFFCTPQQGRGAIRIRP
jgi:hypothetical protein